MPLRALLVALVGSWAVNAGAAALVATVVDATGDVTVLRIETGLAQPVAAGDVLYPGDTLITAVGSRASLLLSDESLVQVNRSTRLVLKAVDQSAGWLPAAAQDIAGSLYELLQGELWFRNKGAAVDVEIETPHVAIGVRGTEFVVRVLATDLTEVDMLEGRIEASNPLGSIEAVSGEQVYAAAGQPPRKRLLLNPENAVQWTALVPPLFTTRKVSSRAPDTQRVLRMLDANNSAAARSELDRALRNSPDDPVLLTIDAWLSLTDARADRAVAQMAEVTAAHPREAVAWSVYALALLTTNRPQEALQAIREAQALTPTDADHYLIESYIHQALFSLDDAVLANERVLQLAPDRLLAVVNAARLQFGLGELRTARELAARARAIDAAEVEVLNLSGFLELASNDSSAALDYFERALATDPAYAESHLGIGLAQMRRGQEAAALESVSTAVALDPTRGLYMTYWGRLLYELERREKAIEILQRAAELDPRDPTPWFIQAVAYRDLNRFGEAIDAYNKAVELNDKRAVYRSRFLLDQDLAVRNVDLSLIYQAYGFDSWAERKAVSAVNDDFGNFSGHIMYAGALAEQENRDVAFLSETLQARLLQPVNGNAFSNFNQYTNFADQPELLGTLRTAQGSFNIETYEAVFSGTAPEQGLGFQASFLDAQSDGWNGFNGDEVNDISALVKWDATLQDSFLLTWSDFEATLFDDLDRRFEFDDIPRPDSRTDSELNRVEFGYRHSFGPGNDLLALIAYTDQDLTNVSDDITDIIVEDFDGAPLIFNTGSQLQRNRFTSWQFQLQWNRRFDAHELIVGTSNYFGDNEVWRSERAFNFAPNGPNQPPTPIEITAFAADVSRKDDRSFHNVYVQDTWRVNDWLELEGAVYLETVRDSEPLVNDSWRISKVNPRAGAIIRPSKQDTIRLAALRYLAPFFSGQLSPTDVAGQTVLRNAREATLNENIEVAWERDWGSGFGSVNGFHFENELEVRPIPTVAQVGPPPTFLFGQAKFDTPIVFIGEGRQKGIELELNQRVGPRFGLVGRYLYADIEDDLFADSDRDESRLELGLTFISSSGFSAALRQGFRRLDLDNRPNNEYIRFTDLDVQYQFPNRKVVLRLEGRNIFDENFNWVTDRFTLGGVIPVENWLGSIEVNF